FQTKPHSVLRHSIAGLASFHSCEQTHKSSRKQFTDTVKGYEYLCPSPSPWILRGVLPSPILPSSGHSVLTLNLTLPPPPSPSTPRQSPAPCVLTPLGRSVNAEFHSGFMSLTETTTLSEWPVNGPGGLVLNPSLLNVVGIKMGAWLGRDTKVRDAVIWVWEEGGGGHGEVGGDLKRYLEDMGAKVRVKRGNYAKIRGVEEWDGGRRLRKETNGGFVEGHEIGGEGGGEDDR
ncbi:hypothetical protein TrRE_jg4625, partial [Triparma retinervis]